MPLETRDVDQFLKLKERLREAPKDYRQKYPRDVT